MVLLLLRLLLVVRRLLRRLLRRRVVWRLLRLLWLLRGGAGQANLHGAIGGGWRGSYELVPLSLVLDDERLARLHIWRHADREHLGVLH